MVQTFLRSLVEGPFAPQMRRFIIVGIVAAAIQMALLWGFVDIARLNYLLGAVIAIEITILFTYVANNAWTFRARQNDWFVEYVVGLLKTNVVRGTAIPIQLAVLFAFVEWGHLSYLVANVIAIGVSGLYRYVLDARWTWGR